MFSSILVVCTGNICRSPIAEYLLRDRWQKSGAKVASAGVGALIGHPADEHAIAVMQNMAGIDMNPHRAQQMNQTLCSSHDLILVMERGHEEWINARMPTARGRVHQMSKWLDGEEVPDPYRRDYAAFEDCYRLLDRCVDGWLERIT